MEPETVFFKILHWTRKILFRKSFWNSCRQVLKKPIQRPKINNEIYIEKSFFSKFSSVLVDMTNLLFFSLESKNFCPTSRDDMIRSKFFWKFYKGQSGHVGCSFDNLAWNFSSGQEGKNFSKPEKKTIQYFSNKNKIFFLKHSFGHVENFFYNPAREVPVECRKCFSKQKSKKSIKPHFFKKILSSKKA